MKGNCNLTANNIPTEGVFCLVKVFADVLALPTANEHAVQAV